MSGMQLLLLHPEVAFRSCEDCQKWVYDEKTGKRQEHAGKPIERYKGIKTPCRYGSQGCPKGTPEENRELTEQNWQTLQFVRECRAVNDFPDDQIVRRHAALVEQVEQSIRDERQRELLEWLRLSVTSTLRG